MNATIPDWKNAPEWANYWTLDVKGVAIWWETKPFYDGRMNMWMNEDDSRRTIGEFTNPPLIRQRPTHAVGQLGLELVPDGDYELSHEWGTWILHVHSDGAHLEQWNKNNTFPNGAPVGCEEIWLGDFKLYRHTPAPTLADDAPAQEA